jgi:hypothetical protein
VLADNHDLHTTAGHIAVGWLVMEDLFTVLVLVVLQVFFESTSATAGRISLAFGIAAIKIAILIGFTFIIGGRVIPWLPKPVGIRQAGADSVFSSEGEVALAFTKTILRSLGATSEQIEREREQIHRDVFWSGFEPYKLGRSTQVRPGENPTPPASADSRRYTI